jgi:hypothetical protein
LRSKHVSVLKWTGTRQTTLAPVSKENLKESEPLAETIEDRHPNKFRKKKIAYRVRQPYVPGDPAMTTETWECQERRQQERTLPYESRYLAHAKREESVRCLYESYRLSFG